MPLKLIAPAQAPGGRSFYIRGSYLGVGVYRSARTDRRAVATAELRKIERDIEHGRHAEAEAPPAASFADAALGYLKDCPQSEVARVKRVLGHFRTTPLAQMTTYAAIDAGEEALFPGRRQAYSAATLNREYRTPLSAVLHHAAARAGAWVKVARYKETNARASSSPTRRSR
jgi:hypothetical protein